MPVLTPAKRFWIRTKQSCGRLAVTSIAAVLVTTTAVTTSSTGPVSASLSGEAGVVALRIDGVGNGHGRGMSQWGAYGWAVNEAKSWQWILDHYYGGTTLGAVSTSTRVEVRLTAADGYGTVGVISKTGKARWNGNSTNSSALRAVETSTNRFDVYSANAAVCPNAATLTVPNGPLLLRDSANNPAHVRDVQTFLNAFDSAGLSVDGDFGPLTKSAVQHFQGVADLAVDGEWRIDEANAARAVISSAGQNASWSKVGSNITGPVTFSTTENESSAASYNVLGLCSGSGSVTHYRGQIEVHDTSDGNRVVNNVLVENYLRGVVPKEVAASWGSAGGGAGMNALRAQSVAARSYGLTQSRYSYAGTCDTPSCQVYGGAAKRSTASSGHTAVEYSLTDQAIADTAGKVRKKNGAIVSTEFSASNGPRTAGGSYPAVDDPADDVAGNPNHRWTRMIDADLVASRYGLGGLVTGTTVADSGSLYDGIWANKVVLDGTSGDRTVSVWDFRNAFGLPAPGFTITPITRDVLSDDTFVFIGDSVGTGITSSATDDLRALLEGVYPTSVFDAVGGRCTVEPPSCIGLDGVADRGVDPGRHRPRRGRTRIQRQPLDVRRRDRSDDDSAPCSRGRAGGVGEHVDPAPVGW